MIVVSDTSPILNLALIERLDLLLEMYQQVIIPPAVYEELTVSSSELPDLLDRTSRDWMLVVAPHDQGRLAALRKELDRGEAEAIVLATEWKADLLLIDERHGRKIAAACGVRITGLLGVLVEAKTKGLVDQVKPLFDELRYRAGFWVNQDLYLEILRKLGES